MIGRVNQGEDLEFYADKFEERQEVLCNLHEENEESDGGFSEEDERESRKTVTIQHNPY